MPEMWELFADKYHLWVELGLCHGLILRYFPDVRDMRAILVNDPESDESWLSVRFVTEGSLDEITAARKKYRKFWVRNIPVEKRHLIRLMYDIEGAESGLRAIGRKPAIIQSQ